MDWEKKFYDIVKETESNLENARRKLLSCSGGKSTNTLQNYDINLPPFSDSQSVISSNNRHMSSVLPHLGGMTTSQSPVYAPLSSTLSTLPLAFPSSSSNYRDLQSRIEGQNKIIERLEHLVRALNQEKDQYRRQLRDLQCEVGSISSLLSENKQGTGSDAHLTEQVDMMRQEVRRDLQNLHQLLSGTRSAAMQTDSLQCNFQNLQHSVHSELEKLHRELINMTRRVGKLELNLSVHNTSLQDPQNYLNKSYSNTSQSNVLGKWNSSYSSVQPGGTSQIKSLRSNVSALNDKLNSLERRLTDSYSLPSPLPTKSIALPLSGLKKLKSKPLKAGSKVSFRDVIVGDDADGVDGTDDEDYTSSDLDSLDLSDDLGQGIRDHSYEDEALSDELEDIVGAGQMKSSKLACRPLSPDLEDLLSDKYLSADVENSPCSSEGLISDLELDKLDLDGDSLDLESLDESVQPDDL